MKFDDFATILALYPITPTEQIAKEFGLPEKMIGQLANCMGVYKEGRKHSGKGNNSMLVTYNARNATVHLMFGNSFEVKYSKKPVKLEVEWKNL